MPDHGPGPDAAVVERTGQPRGAVALPTPRPIHGAEPTVQGPRRTRVAGCLDRHEAKTGRSCKTLAPHKLSGFDRLLAWLSGSGFAALRLLSHLLCFSPPGLYHAFIFTLHLRRPKPVRMRLSAWLFCSGLRGTDLDC